MFYFNFRKYIIKEKRGYALGCIWGKKEKDAQVRSKGFTLSLHSHYQKNIVCLLYLCSTFFLHWFLLYSSQNRVTNLQPTEVFLFFCMRSALHLLQFTSVILPYYLVEYFMHRHFLLYLLLQLSGFLLTSKCWLFCEANTFCKSVRPLSAFKMYIDLYYCTVK